MFTPTCAAGLYFKLTLCSYLLLAINCQVQQLTSFSLFLILFDFFQKLQNYNIKQYVRIGVLDV